MAENFGFRGEGFVDPTSLIRVALQVELWSTGIRNGGVPLKGFLEGIYRV